MPLLTAAQVNNDDQSFDQDQEGARSDGAAEPDGAMVISRGCEGPQPSKPITAIKVLIVTWRAHGPSAPRNPMGQ
jgi:hypothetical protein